MPAPLATSLPFWYATIRMKLRNAFLVCLALVFCCASSSLADDYGSALRRAKKEDKPALVYFFSKYCSYCEAMDKEVLLDPEIAELLKKYTVFVRVDVDKRPDLAEAYNLRGFPTTWLLQPSGKRIGQAPGFLPKKEFRKIIAYLRGKHYQVMGLGEFLRSSRS
jgi:thioredoxin-related protein